MPCSHCGKDSKIVARGICRTCYTRWHRSGSLEYKRKGKPPTTCSVEDCYDLHVARGYCEKHYRMFVKRGMPISLFGYGEKRKHPLYDSWRTTGRTNTGRDSEWNDFWNFVNDVEPSKPSINDGKYFLSRVDINKKWGPDNFYWKKVLPATEDTKEYQRRWRQNNPEKAKSFSLKRQFGIDLKEYIKMYESQNGKCYICGSHGTMFSEKSDIYPVLAVDHCHKTGKIRKLLCPKCNGGIGMFRDNPTLLRKAANYLSEYLSSEESGNENFHLFSDMIVCKSKVTRRL